MEKIMKRKKAKLQIRTAALLCAAGIGLTGCGGKNVESKQPVSEPVEQSVGKIKNGIADEPKASEWEGEGISDSADVENEAVSGEERTDTDEENKEKAHTLPEARTVYEAQIRHYYGGILSQITAGWQLPDGELDTSTLEDGFGKMSDNRFAVTDIDGDGREELIIQYTNACMAGMFERIYDYDPGSGELKCEFLNFPALTYYSNGIIKAEWSHNQGRGESWPYTLYRYDAASDSYVEVGSVDSWDKALSETWYEGQPFPDELDTDGDGTLFTIWEAGEEEDPYAYEKIKYNQADVDEWLGGYLAGAPEDAKEVSIDYQPLEHEAYADFTPVYLKMLAENANSGRTDTDEDLGLLILRDEEEHFLDAAKRLLAEKYDMILEQPDPDFEEYTVGKIGDSELFSFEHLNAGFLTYKGEKTGNVTIFGIYPGISVDGAWEKLKAYGFYASPYGEVENCLITGEGFGNVEVWFDAEEGKVTTITVRPFCAFAG